MSRYEKKLRPTTKPKVSSKEPEPKMEKTERRKLTVYEQTMLEKDPTIPDNVRSLLQRVSDIVETILGGTDPSEDHEDIFDRVERAVTVFEKSLDKPVKITSRLTQTDPVTFSSVLIVEVHYRGIEYLVGEWLIIHEYDKAAWGIQYDELPHRYDDGSWR